MKRGEIWTIRGDGYASKPRSVVVVQDEKVARFDSVILCLLTSFDSSGMPTRVFVEPTPDNGLDKPSYVIADKIVSVDKALLGQQIGTLEPVVMKRVDECLCLVLGLPVKFSEH